MKLILVRHGETLLNRENRVQGTTDIELSDRGRLQAEKLAQSLRAERIERIVSSPLKRAYETALAISRFHGAEIEAHTNLQELNHGDFENMTIEELREKHMAVLRQWASDPASVILPNGESLRDLQHRAWAVVHDIARDERDAVVVTHNMTIRTIICKIQGLDMQHIRGMRVDLASKTFVEFQSGKGTITVLNDISHLKET
ncbi:MAG TPA: histidine phosphatase family protein [Syntrophales bacterium]|nr:histidine phosphatase family protein [Syntrophales bacterium]